MTIPDGYHDVAAGKLAAVVTCLEMTQPPKPREDPPGVDCTLVRREKPELAWYRELFRTVGEPVLWYSRLAMNDAELAATIGDPLVEVYAVQRGGDDAGLLELDFRVERECELGFFGLVESAIGHGAGRWLMNRAIEIAWSHPIERFWVHTCTLDHPGIVQFYERSGFRPFKRQIEVFDDPRLQGAIARTAAPHVPLL
ncbi:MAG: GNAT family N-acetyltransferase [Candidatus Eremiobacteraeota bacterium]|nr:GNAT family N-acetyltransferase [Candidatus Eremiobacteraeota bacterium]